jgi:hypothetical protein
MARALANAGMLSLAAGAGQGISAIGKTGIGSAWTLR